MGIFSNIIATIKRNTLDKTDLDERIVGGVKQMFAPPKMVSPVPQSQPTQPRPTPVSSPTIQPNRPMPSSTPLLSDRPQFKTAPAQKLSQRLDQIKRNITGNLPTWGQAAKNVGDVFTKPLVPGRPSIVEAARMTAPTVAKDFGDMFRKTNLLPEPVKQMVANTGEHIGNATVNSVMGIDDILQGKKVQGAFRTLKGVGQFATAAMPLNTAVNVASQVGTDKTKRVATGMQRGMSMVDTLSPNTKENKWIKGKLPLVGEFEIDPLVAGGQMAGFTQNALNKGIYKITNKYIPMEYNTISKWLAGNGTRGGIENLIQTLDQMPEDPKEQIPFLVSTFGIGAVMEIGGQGMNAAGKKVLSTKVAKQALNQLKKFQAYANEPVLTKTLNDVEGGFAKFTRIPRWQVIARDINRVLGDKLPIGMTIKNVKGEGTGFPRIGDSWDSAVADAEQVIKNGDLTPEQANEVIPQTAIRNHIAAIVDLVEKKIGRQLSPEELTTFSKDYTIYRSNGDTGEALVSDNYLKSRYGYDERSISNILKNRKTQPGSTLANADETRMVDSEPAWKNPYKPKEYINNAPPDTQLMEQFDKNGNPILGTDAARRTKPIWKMTPEEMTAELSSKKPIASILKPEADIQPKIVEPPVVATKIEPVTAEPRKWNVEKKAFWDNPQSSKPTRFEDDIDGTLGKLEVMDELEYSPSTIKDDVRDLRDLGFTADEIRDVISGKRSAFDIFKAEHSDVAPTKQTIDQILTSKAPAPEPKIKVEEKVIDSKTGLEKALEEVNAQALKRNAKLDAQSKRLTKKYGVGEDQLIQLFEGKVDVSDADKKVLETISNYLADANGIPVEGRLPNHFPHLDVTRPERMTPSSSYAGRIAGTYDPSMTRRNLIPEENLEGSVEALKQSGYSADQKRYGDVFQAKTIMEENNLPREKGDEVLEAVKKQGERVKELEDGHLKNTGFNEIGEVDHLKDARAFDDEIARIAGKPTNRPVIKARMKSLLSKAADASVNVIRGDNNVIQQRTNKEVFDAYKVMRDSNLPNSRAYHNQALENFIKVASGYEFEDKQVEGIINRIIDNEIKTGKVKQSLYTQSFRLITGLFSGAHIGGNVKTVITQPTELYRVAAEEGVGNLRKGFATVFKETPRLRKDYGLDEMTAQMLEANPEFKKIKAETLMDKVSDLNEKTLNVTMAGMKWSEEWKNTILVAAAEQKGLQKGLKVGSETMTHFVRDELFRVGHIGSKYSTPQIIKGKGGKAALLQYSQYALKNFVLKYDTALDAEKPALTRAANVFKQVLADTAATLTVAGITGIPVKTVLELFGNSQLPTGLGAIYSVPKEMWDEFNQYNTDQANAKPGQEVESLGSRWGNTLQRNIQPVGNQYLKSKGGAEALSKGYGESKKGNVKYTTGDLNPIQKAQVLLFGAGAIPNKQKSDKMYADLDAGKSTVYPTLGKEESAVLKGLPKDQQEAYYDQKMRLRTPTSSLVKGETAKKPNLIESILGGKKVEAKSLTAIPDATTSPDELSKFNSYVKEKLDNGIAPTDEELKAYFFSKIDKMPTSTGSETQNKQVELFKKIDSIYESQTLDDATKDRLIAMSGLSKEDAEYYNLAKDDSTVKAMREEEKSGTMSREEWLRSLGERRRMVGNKQIIDNGTVDQLYERGVISDAERDFIKAIKYDPATKELYMDRDYKGGSGGSATTKKATLSKMATARQDIYDQKAKTRKVADKQPSQAKTISSILAKRKTPNSKTISSVLGQSGKSISKITTPTSRTTAKMKVKRKYY